MKYQQELETALYAAKLAGEIQMEYKKKLLDIKIKGDNSPVTQVDALCEKTIRDTIEKKFPHDGFMGEETGENKGQSGRIWIVDPLDGTRPYIKGIPTHSVLIALLDGENMTVGCMNLPAMGEIYYASKGSGAFMNGSAIHVSQTSSKNDIFGSGFGHVEKAGSSDSEMLLKVMNSWNYSYGFMDAYTYGCIASGRIDASVNLLDRPWDCAAAVCIVEEAGGRFSDISGSHTVFSGSCVLSNGLVHDAVLEYFLEN
jgi:histidinol-phosphatase